VAIVARCRRCGRLLGRTVRTARWFHGASAAPGPGWRTCCTRCAAAQ